MFLPVDQRMRWPTKWEVVLIAAVLTWIILGLIFQIPGPGPGFRPPGGDRLP